ncbi:8025_t:CDS:2 [Diversispora eburnea]|uniref:8025_t:CDS:1 n=1 Tax=Diversispora eburnea TaxID=1213867 RepID=A0A9N8ZEW1_9GLOM|nr:8025_t:CDS:2 [Diversispora eburnea]
MTSTGMFVSQLGHRDYDHHDTTHRPHQPLANLLRIFNDEEQMNGKLEVGKKRKVGAMLSYTQKKKKNRGKNKKHKGADLPEYEVKGINEKWMGYSRTFRTVYKRIIHLDDLISRTIKARANKRNHMRRAQIRIRQKIHNLNCTENDVMGSWKISGEANFKGREFGKEVKIVEEAYTRQQFFIIVEPDYDILQLKEIIEKLIGISKEVQVLYFFGEILEDNHTISSYEIQKDSILHLKFKNESKKCFTILYYDPKSKITKETVVKVKPKITKIKDVLKQIPLKNENLRLFHLGQELKDDYTFEYYSIDNNNSKNLYCRQKIKVCLDSSDWHEHTEVYKNSSIGELFDIIQQKKGIEPERQTIYFKGERLKIGKVLTDYGIGMNFGLYVVIHPNSDVFNVNLRDPNGEIIPVRVTSNTSVYELKNMIKRIAVDYPIPKQRIIYCGKELEDGQKLSYYDIQEEKIFHLKMFSLWDYYNHANDENEIVGIGYLNSINII